MELVVERPVGPRDPDDAEDDEELDVAAQRDGARELARRLRDDDDVDEVGEELEEADPAFGLDLAVGAGRSPEPAAETAEGARFGRGAYVADGVVVAHAGGHDAISTRP